MQGTLCCLSHLSQPELGERDLRYVQLAARLVGREIERQRSRALEIHEQMIEQLTMALYHLDADDADEARGCLEAALGNGRTLTGELLGRGVSRPGYLRASTDD